MNRTNCLPIFGLTCGLFVVTLAAGCGVAQDVQKRTQHISEESVKDDVRESGKAAQSKVQRDTKKYEEPDMDDESDEQSDQPAASDETSDGSDETTTKTGGTKVAQRETSSPETTGGNSAGANKDGSNGPNRTAGISTWTEQKPATWTGDACREVYYQPSDYKPGTSLDKQEAGLKQHVLLTACTQHIIEYKSGAITKDRPQNPKVAPLDIERIHREFDDRQFDHLSVALMSVYAEFGFPASLGGKIDRVSPPLQGIAYGYTKRLKPGAVRERLNSMNLPSKAVDTFMALVKSSIEGAKSRMKKLDEAERIILYEVPARVIQQRFNNYQRYSELYERLDALTEKVESALSESGSHYELTRKIARLRGDFLDMCDADNCLMTPEYQRIVQQLKLLYLADQNAPGLYAERMAYDQPKTKDEPPLVDIRSLAHHVQYERRQTAYPMYGKHREYKDAIDSGASKKAALAMVGGGPVLKTSPHNLTIGRLEIEMSNMVKNLDTAGPIEDARATVKEIERADETARLIFVQEQHTRHVPYDCVETDKIDRITPDGRIIYRTNCQWKKTTSESAQFPPVTVPAYEADAIQPGDAVRFAVVDDDSSKKGHVIRVFRNGEVIQLREHSVK